MSSTRSRRSRAPWSHACWEGGCTAAPDHTDAAGALWKRTRQRCGPLLTQGMIALFRLLLRGSSSSTSCMSVNLRGSGSSGLWAGSLTLLGRVT